MSSWSASGAKGAGGEAGISGLGCDPALLRTAPFWLRHTIGGGVQ